MQDFKQRCLVLSASTYQITDEKGEVTAEGMTIFYLPTDNLELQDDQVARGRGQMSLGLQPAKVTMPLEMQQKILQAPAMYELTLKMVTRQMKAQIQPVDFEFVGNVELQTT
jgi:hypothetical protein